MNQKREACSSHSVGFGILKGKSDLVICHEEKNTNAQLTLDLGYNCLELYVYLKRRNGFQYRFRTRLTQIRCIQEVNERGGLSVVIQLEYPPQLARLKANSRDWNRQTIIYGKQPTTTTLLSPSAILETGRWLTWRLEINNANILRWEALSRSLPVPVVRDTISITTITPPRPIDWFTPPDDFEILSASMAQLGLSRVHLTYEVQYQLEVCISHGYLLECSIDYNFTSKLAELDHTTGIKHMAQYLLEYVASVKQCFYDPMAIFKLLFKVATFKPSPPSYCVLLQSATVTPTTIYFHTPTVEMSNRILRKYSHYDRQFLRVKFRDEEYFGRLQSNKGDEAVYERIKRTLQNGITVGGRTFEFLAYGNSQLREHGAYFFASTKDISAKTIRESMGTFDKIKVVAKYASRLGQAFSSTRESWKSFDIVEIPDIEHNGHCFTDGVGKMSKFVSRMIADHLKLSSNDNNDPSAYQFRLAGYKGIMVLDPHLERQNIALRPSQLKFEAKDRGLEICRWSTFSSAYLNQQIILILTVLGVPDDGIIERQQDMIRDLKIAMTDEHMALELLLKCVDHNQTTLQLAKMLEHGFMSTHEPFFETCMRLWHSWCVKWLKEKAKILIPGGAFVLGCVDEFAVLKGHFDSNSQTTEQDQLPQIFLQTRTIDAKDSSLITTKIITGLCMVARNPSLHPGDIRVVNAVDVPELHHLKNVVVFPQEGIRDIPSMCSGGDLDGDDYLVIWDTAIIPREWNHRPMNYTAPNPVVKNGAITVEDVSSFFVKYMAEDNLGRVATYHRYWADRLQQGVKDEQCIRLAHMHSRAVDYPKTGVPAVLTKSDKFDPPWPRWANKKGARPHQIYDSNGILHKLYRSVDLVEFQPDQEHQFDRRILEAYPLKDEQLTLARLIKKKYDIAIRGIMAKHQIKSEYEVWTTFVLSHNNETRDWTLAEVLGHSLNAIKEQYRKAVFEVVGTTEQLQEPIKLAPFITAMYVVTAQEDAMMKAKQKEKFATVEIYEQANAMIEEIDSMNAGAMIDDSSVVDEAVMIEDSSVAEEDAGVDRSFTEADAVLDDSGIADDVVGMIPDHNDIMLESSILSSEQHRPTEQRNSGGIETVSTHGNVDAETNMRISRADTGGTLVLQEDVNIGGVITALKRTTAVMTELEHDDSIYKTTVAEGVDALAEVLKAQENDALMESRTAKEDDTLMKARTRSKGETFVGTISKQGEDALDKSISTQEDNAFLEEMRTGQNDAMLEKISALENPLIDTTTRRVLDTIDNSSTTHDDGVEDNLTALVSFPWIFQRELGLIATGCYT